MSILTLIEIEITLIKSKMALLHRVPIIFQKINYPKMISNRNLAIESLLHILLGFYSRYYLQCISALISFCKLQTVSYYLCLSFKIYNDIYLLSIWLHTFTFIGIYYKDWSIKIENLQSTHENIHHLAWSKSENFSYFVRF